MRQEEYNGWTNYETWLVALWIDNDEGTHERRRAIFEDLRPSPMVWGNLGALGRSVALAYADALKEWAESPEDEGGLMPELGASLASDLLGAALAEVDWRSIAESWISDYPETEPLEEDEEVKA